MNHLAPLSIALLICVHVNINISDALAPAPRFCSLSDYHSLKAFQSSIFSPLPWPNSSNCCLWAGIQCNPQGRVVSVHLPSLGLRGVLSPRLSDLSALHSLNLSHNSLFGPFPPHVANLSSLSTLDVSHNPLLAGAFPSQLPPQLHYLNLIGCSFYGAIPASIANATAVKELHLAYNMFSSFAAVDMASMRALEIFDASNNGIHGSFPHYVTNCTNLRVLNFNDNNLGGPLPSQLGKLRNLYILQLQANRFTGAIPAEIGNCSQLRQVWLDDNFLNGSIPEVLWELEFLVALSLANNSLQGMLPTSNCHCYQLSFLSLSGNLLSGDIPAALGTLVNLKVLLLDHNSFSGLVPAESGWLSQFCLFDLSNNNVTGLVLLEHASLINVEASFNSSLRACHNHECLQLTRVLNNDFKRRFSGIENTTMVECLLAKNKVGLYSTVSRTLTDVPNVELPRTQTPAHSHPKRTKLFAGVGALSAVLLMVGLFLICLMMRIRSLRHKRLHKPPMKLASLRRFRTESSKVFDPSLKSISMRILGQATGNFDNGRVIGDGGFGLVFLGTLPDGRAVAVKKLAPDGMQGKREFEAEMETLARVKHPNLVELLAYCTVGDERVLVYDFIENGSLDTWLHEKEGGPRKLLWRLRLRIAQGAASGLVYLHHECNPHVLHRDIKTSNILLDKELEAHIADFGLARNMSTSLSHVSTGAAGTLGYMAPEYSNTLKATRQADVYSFGMVMLELATGRRPNVFVKERNLRTLVRWVRQLCEEGQQLDLLDPTLKKETPPPYEQVSAYFNIACECVREAPADRPTMELVLNRLDEIAQDYSNVATP